MKEKINTKQMAVIRRLYKLNKSLLFMRDYGFKQEQKDIKKIVELEHDLWGRGVDEKTFSKMQREVKIYKIITIILWSILFVYIGYNMGLFLRSI